MTIIYIYTHTHAHTHTQDALMSELSLFTNTFASMYRLIIEYSFMFTNYSFNNRVTHESNLIEPSPNEFTGSFASFKSLPASQ
jgi:hypothetical protein